MENTSTNVFGLLTDFGFDYAVASMKGIIVKAIPTAQIIDVDHSLKKFSIISAAFIIEKSARYFPDTTVFVCVIDPGVGSNRQMLCVQYGSQWFVGPDNGIFHHLFSQPGTQIYRIKNGYFAPQSRTFHGRDIFVVAAIKLAQGHRDFLELIDIEAVEMLSIIDTHNFITYIDSFGNIKTDISIEAEPDENAVLAISMNGTVHSIPWNTIFAHVQPGSPFCYKGSNDTLEIAVNYGSAQHYFNVDVGTEIKVSL